MTAHPSDSEVQQSTHRPILDWPSSPQSGLDLPPLAANQRVPVAGGASVVVDGVAPDNAAFVEVYARVTPVKGAGFLRVASDILKLRLIKDRYPDAQAIIAFASVEAAESITGWRRAAADSAGIRLVVAEIPEATRGALLSAQTRQRMVNVPPTESVREQQ